MTEIKPRYKDPDAPNISTTNTNTNINENLPSVPMAPIMPLARTDTRPVWDVICENKIIVLVIVIIIILTSLLVYIIFYYNDKSKDIPKQPNSIQPTQGAHTNQQTPPAPQTSHQNNTNVPDTTTQAVPQAVPQAAAPVTTEQYQANLASLIERSKNLQTPTQDTTVNQSTQSLSNINARENLVAQTTSGKSDDELRQLMEDSASVNDDTDHNVSGSGDNETNNALDLNNSATSTDIQDNSSYREGLCSQVLQNGRLCKGKALKGGTKCSRHQ